MIFRRLESAPRTLQLTAIYLSAVLCSLMPGTVTAIGPSELWRINTDGSGLEIIADTTGYTCGSPEASPDGKLIAYGAWRVDQNLRDAHIFVMRADGTERHDLGPGAMPNWSPDGKQLVFHTYAGIDSNTDHIVVMNADGTDRKNILDHWGSPRWSRGNNRIVSILDDNLAVYDLATKQEQSILPQAQPMYLGFGVSPDGKRFCFSGSKSGLYLADLDEKTMQAKVRTLIEKGKSQYVSFAPDNKRIVFSWIPPGARTSQLYIMDVDAEAKPTRLDDQDKSRFNWAPNWSADGKTILFASKALDK